MRGKEGAGLSKAETQRVLGLPGGCNVSVPLRGKEGAGLKLPKKDQSQRDVGFRPLAG